jgi:hypothetical protein
MFKINRHEGAPSGRLDGHADRWQADMTKRQSLVAALEAHLERTLLSGISALGIMKEIQDNKQLQHL